MKDLTHYFQSPPSKISNDFDGVKEPNNTEMTSVISPLRKMGTHSLNDALEYNVNTNLSLKRKQRMGNVLKLPDLSCEMDHVSETLADQVKVKQNKIKVIRHKLYKSHINTMHASDFLNGASKDREQVCNRLLDCEDVQPKKKRRDKPIIDVDHIKSVCTDSKFPELNISIIHDNSDLEIFAGTEKNLESLLDQNEETKCSLKKRSKMLKYESENTATKQNLIKDKADVKFTVKSKKKVKYLENQYLESSKVTKELQNESETTIIVQSKDKSNSETTLKFMKSFVKDNNEPSLIVKSMKLKCKSNKKSLLSKKYDIEDQSASASSFEVKEQPINNIGEACKTKNHKQLKKFKHESDEENCSSKHFVHKETVSNDKEKSQAAKNHLIIKNKLNYEQDKCYQIMQTNKTNVIDEGLCVQQPDLLENNLKNAYKSGKEKRSTKDIPALTAVNNVGTISDNAILKIHSDNKLLTQVLPEENPRNSLFNYFSKVDKDISILKNDEKIKVKAIVHTPPAEISINFSRKSGTLYNDVKQYSDKKSNYKKCRAQLNRSNAIDFVSSEIIDLSDNSADLDSGQWKNGDPKYPLVNNSTSVTKSWTMRVCMSPNSSQAEDNGDNVMERSEEVCFKESDSAINNKHVLLSNKKRRILLNNPNENKAKSSKAKDSDVEKKVEDFACVSKKVKLFRKGELVTANGTELTKLNRSSSKKRKITEVKDDVAEDTKHQEVIYDRKNEIVTSGMQILISSGKGQLNRKSTKARKVTSNKVKDIVIEEPEEENVTVISIRKTQPLLSNWKGQTKLQSPNARKSTSTKATDVLREKENSSSVKIPNIFLKGVQASKSVLNVDKKVAKQRFLESGVPNIIKLKVARQRADMPEALPASFPTVSHVQQRDMTRVVWNLVVAKLPLRPLLAMSPPPPIAWSSPLPQFSAARMSPPRRFPPATSIKRALKQLRKEEPDVASCYKTLLDIKCSARKPNTLPDWGELYRPVTGQDLIGNGGNIRQLTEWLELQIKSNKEDGIVSSRTEFESESDGEGIRGANMAVIFGPSGCGKTSAVYAVSKQLGFQVLEVNGSSNRSGKKLLAELSEATQSHQVERSNVLATFFCSTGEQSKKKKKKKSKHKELIEDKRSKMTSLILIEDADIVFEDHDEGFISAIGTLASSSKRPLVLVANNSNCPHIARLNANFQLSLHFRKPVYRKLALWLRLVALVEGVELNKEAAESLAMWSGGDVRRCLLQLQLTLLSGMEQQLFETELEPCRLWWSLPLQRQSNGLELSEKQLKIEENISGNTKKLEEGGKKTKWRQLAVVQQATQRLAYLDVLSRRLTQAVSLYEPYPELYCSRLKSTTQVTESQERSCERTESTFDFISQWLCERVVKNVRCLPYREIAENIRLCGRRRETEMLLSAAVPEFVRCSHMAVAGDYAPALRSLARTERVRLSSQSRRANRYFNYLEGLGIEPKPALIEVLVNTLNT